MEKLTIEKGWYWSAGKRFDWKKDGIPDCGVGIARPLLKENKEMLVNVDGEDYHLDCVEAVTFINKYKCFENIAGVWIGYVPKTLLKKHDSN